MKPRTARALYALLICIAGGVVMVWLVTRPRSRPAPTHSAEPALTNVQAVALAHAAVATSVARTNPERAISEYKIAIQLEPDNPEWKQGLAFTLHHYANRTSDAIPIWRELAKGTGEDARLATRWLNKAKAK